VHPVNPARASGDEVSQPKLEVDAMVRQSALISVLAPLLVIVPGADDSSRAANTQYLRVATLVPRDSELARSFLKSEPMSAQYQAKPLPSPSRRARVQREVPRTGFFDTGQVVDQSD
jgi:hypothetical protein